MKQDWEKRFDDKFLCSLLPLLPMIPNRNLIFEIKDFIRQARSEGYKEGIEKAKKELWSLYKDESFILINRNFNDVLDLAIFKLEHLKKKGNE